MNKGNAFHDIKNLTNQTCSFSKFVNNKSNLVAASFEVSNIITRHGNLSLVVIIIRNHHVHFICEDFERKTKSILRIKYLPPC